LREEDVHYQKFPKSQPKGAWREKEMRSAEAKVTSMLAHSCPNNLMLATIQILYKTTKESKIKHRKKP
jgi:hypothetical protein